LGRISVDTHSENRKKLLVSHWENGFLQQTIKKKFPRKMRPPQTPIKIPKAKAQNKICNNKIPPKNHQTLASPHEF
jgi:hypothetical protein